MKKAFLFLLLLPCLSPAKSLEEFFNEHADLKSNIFTRDAITSQARVATLNDVMLQKQPGEMSGHVMNRLLKENGYDYARLAMRQLSEVCNSGMAESSVQLKKDDCALIIKNAD
ncbi:TPA: hypothetical protein ACKQDC_000189 [Serratia marcescens]|nr:hypothetical protein [Serratia marcescens]